MEVETRMGSSRCTRELPTSRALSKRKQANTRNQHPIPAVSSSNNATFSLSNSSNNSSITSSLSTSQCSSSSTTFSRSSSRLRRQFNSLCNNIARSRLSSNSNVPSSPNLWFLRPMLQLVYGLVRLIINMVLALVPVTNLGILL